MARLLRTFLSGNLITALIPESKGRNGIMKRLKTLVLSVMLLLSGIGIGAFGSNAFVAPASAQTQWQSNSNIWRVRHRLDDLLAQLNNDDRDYGGHRVAAINDLQQGRMELLRAERFARDHGY